VSFYNIDMKLAYADEELTSKLDASIGSYFVTSGQMEGKVIRQSLAW